MLEAQALTKRYAGLPAVDAVSFEIRPGEVLGYLGPNGAGKSTTVKMLIGLVKPTSGRILFRGEDIHRDLKAFQARLGYVPEEANLYPHLSGREYLELAGRLRGIPREVLGPRIDELLSLLGLTESRYARIGAYSKGMRQKILLIASILHNPEVLILDEPFSGLDVSTALILRNIIRGFAERGKAVLYSSHVLEVVEKICSRVLILRKGRVAAHDSVARLRDMLAESSLEGVFAHVTEAGREEEAAGRILEVVTA